MAVRLISEKVACDLGIDAPDHLQHQQLVEIGVEQAADDRIELPGVIVGPARNIGHCHGRILTWLPLRNQWVWRGAGFPET